MKHVMRTGVNSIGLTGMHDCEGRKEKDGSSVVWMGTWLTSRMVLEGDLLGLLAQLHRVKI